MVQQIRQNYRIYFSKLDFGKFRQGIKPDTIFKMLIWMVDGYMHEQQMYGTQEDWNELEQMFEGWIQMFKRIAYKEEYL